MAETRRMEVTTITQGSKKKPKENPLTTHRFSLTLTNTTETTCPEFSFSDLTKNALKKLAEKVSLDPDDPFGEHDAAEQKKLEAIAKAFEEKYAPRLKTQGGCDRLSDLVDLGDGYDDTDHFIDNSEAYDELIPACMTTKLGGFYINSGHLDFKYISDDSSEEFQVNNSVKKKRVNRIDSDSESDEEQPKKGPQKRKFKDGVEVERKKRKKLLLGPDGERIKMKRGRKPLDDKLKKKKNSPTVAELLKQQTASTSTPSHVVNGCSDDVENTVSSRQLEKSIESTFDAVLSEAMGGDSGSHDGTDKKPSNPESIIPLPLDLPASLIDIIEQIKQAARESREGKCKFFSGNVNKLLLDIEIGSRQMAFGHRTTIYTHLSSFLPCSKETLIKRAKKLRLGQQNDQLRKPLRKLKEVVDNVMPLLQEQYEAEHQKALQMRVENKEKGEGDSSVKDYASTESDEEEKTNQDLTNKKRIIGPRKKFMWTDHIREGLCDVVRVKMQMFTVSKVRAQTAEEYLRAFLDAEVKTLWPQGWMQTRMLFKQSRSVHANWTNQNKARKTLLTAKAASPTPPTIPVNRDLVNKNPLVTPSVKKTTDVVEIVSSSGEEEKVVSGPDLDSDCINIEDYITSEDFDCLLSSIGTAEPQISMLLDYPDKTPVTTTTVGSSAGSTTVKSTSLVTQPKHSTSVSTESTAHISETPARNLVADILQKPSATKTKTTTSLHKPTAVLAGSRESPFMAEFQKHLILSAAVSTQDEPPHSISNQTTDLLSTPRLQSMLTSPLSSQSAKYQSSGNKQYEQFLKQQNYIHSEPRPQKVVSSHQSKSLSQVPGAQVNIIDSRVKVDSSHVKQDRGSVSANSIIDKEAMKQLHQRLLQMAGSGKMSGLVKDRSHHGLSSQQTESRKAHDAHKSSVDSSVRHQLFKQPLPASNAAQMRLSPQQSKTVQSSGQKSSVSSSGKSDMQIYQSGTLHRHPAQAHQKAPSAGQTQQSSGLANRQPSPSHVSRTLYSPANNRQSASSYVAVASSTTSRQTSVSQVHGNSQLSSMGGRRPGITHGSPTKLTDSASRNSPTSSRVAMSPHTSPTTSNSHIREQSTSQSFLSKVIESEMKATSLPQSSHVKVSQSNRGGGGQNKGQVMWPASQPERVAPYNTSSVSSVLNSFSGDLLPGYQSLKLSSSSSRDHPVTGSYAVVSPSLQQQGSALVAGSRSSHSQPVSSKTARPTTFSSQSGHPMSPQVTQIQGQTTPVTQLQPSPQIPDSTHSTHSSHGY
ncbi:ubinuclein-1-like isoform X2 [Gigantopelta aegis]|uniref:ubinuclein-1-like isoform X2 n=1 Tax=Gigantopelta aegis TaxID=1735272 RepID=UPI001B888540|nr:ubinuclein-1-like isoform X2 [Gigantopelta aegis]